MKNIICLLYHVWYLDIREVVKTNSYGNNLHQALADMKQIVGQHLHLKCTPIAEIIDERIVEKYNDSIKDRYSAKFHEMRSKKGMGHSEEIEKFVFSDMDSKLWRLPSLLISLENKFSTEELQKLETYAIDYMDNKYV